MKNKIRTIIGRCLVGASFFLLSLCAFDFIFALCEVVGAIVSGSMDCALKDFSRMVPFFFNFIMSILFAVIMHKINRNGMNGRTVRSIIKIFYAGIISGSLTIIYVVINLFTGLYGSLTVGYPTKIYPLDSIIVSLFFMVLYIPALVLFKRRKRKHPDDEAFKMPKKNGKLHFVYCIFSVIWLLCAGFGFSAVINSGVIIEWAPEHLFFNISVLLMFILPTVYFVFFEFVFRRMKEDNRGKLRNYSICGIALSVIVLALYLVAYFNDPLAPMDSCMGIFTVDFTATVNAFTYLYGICNLAVPVTSLMFALFKKYDI